MVPLHLRFVTLSLIIQEHLWPGQDFLHSSVQVSKASASLHESTLKTKKKFSFFVAFLAFTVISLTVFFTDSKKEYFLQCK